MAGLPNQLVELLLRHICDLLRHYLPESILDMGPHGLLAIVVAGVRRLEKQHESVARISLVFVNEIFDRLSFVSCMVIQHNIGQLRELKVLLTDLPTQLLQKCYQIVLVRAFR